MGTKMIRHGAFAAVFLSVLMAAFPAGPAHGASFDLRTGVVTKTMPDNAVVTMWGFGCTTVQAGCDNTDIVVPGPALSVPVGDNTLIINLTNNLAEPASIVISGLTPALATVVPVKFADNTARQRTMSFVNEAAAGGGTATYTWNNVRPGTYLYESGTHPSVQVQMGLYGSVRKDFATGQAYGPASAYTKELILFFSEIDPTIHAAVADGSYGTAPAPTSTMYYRPRYFLINGEPYSAARPALAQLTQADNTLVRFLNAGNLTHVPMIQGLYMKLIAEDAHPYATQKNQYGVDLDPGKTVDALFTLQGAGGRLAIFDRKLGTMNWTASPGGMIAYLNAASLRGLGVFQNGSWNLDLNGNGVWDSTPTDAQYFFGEGLAGAVPVTGDWNGTGTTKIGVYHDGYWYLDLSGNNGWNGTPTDALYAFGGGLAGAVPVTGDWNGTGATKIGIYVDGVWYLDLNGNGAWDGTPTDGLYFFGGGVAGAIPVTGDWNGSGTTKIGIYTDGVWYLDQSGNGAWDGTPTDGLYFFGGGLVGAIPATGDWSGSGTTKIGIYADGVWYLDQSGNGAWDGTPTDIFISNFNGGLVGAVPVTGNW